MRINLNFGRYQRTESGGSSGSYGHQEPASAQSGNGANLKGVQMIRSNSGRNVMLASEQLVSDARQINKQAHKLI